MAAAAAAAVRSRCVCGRACGDGAPLLLPTPMDVTRTNFFTPFLNAALIRFKFPCGERREGGEESGSMQVGASAAAAALGRGLVAQAIVQPALAAENAQARSEGCASAEKCAVPQRQQRARRGRR